MVRYRDNQFRRGDSRPERGSNCCFHLLRGCVGLYVDLLCATLRV
jgi:hypothetical protein